MNARLCGSCLLLVLTGCINEVPLRAASTYVLTDAASRITLPAPEDEVVAMLSQVVGERGFYRTAKYDVARSVRYYTWRADKQPHVRGTPEPPAMPKHDLGTWLLARVDTHRTALTDILLIAKPTVDEREVCADSDAYMQEANYRCIDTMVKSSYAPEKLPNGAPEAELVGYALKELKARFESK